MRFRLPPQPQLIVERGAFVGLPRLLQDQGYSRPILVTGGRSVRGRDEWGIVTDTLLENGFVFQEFTIRGEPSPTVVNEAVREIIREAPESDVVVAVGGGSALDAGKAIAAGVAITSTSDRNVEDFDITRYLEGVGSETPDGCTLPVVAFPTTAGTGTEATMNAVISRIGPRGFKKSLRHSRFVPSVAVLDVDLHRGCPQDVTRASGLDAITQLLEAYISTSSNVLTDQLAALGLTHAGMAFPRLITGEDTPELRTHMAVAAYLGGVCLAAAGLGVVHGYASPLGAYRDIPHGVVCGLLLGPSIEHSAGSLATPRGSFPSVQSVRDRYGEAARLIGVGDDAAALADRTREWAVPLGKLRDYGFVASDIPRIAAETGLKNHPVNLEAAALRSILEEVL